MRPELSRKISRLIFLFWYNSIPPKWFNSWKSIFWWPRRTSYSRTNVGDWESKPFPQIQKANGIRDSRYSFISSSRSIRHRCWKEMLEKFWYWSIKNFLKEKFKNMDESSYITSTNELRQIIEKCSKCQHNSSNGTFIMPFHHLTSIF